jgi:hypothetical protein
MGYGAGVTNAPVLYDCRVYGATHCSRRVTGDRVVI